MTSDPALAFLRAIWALDHALHRSSKRMARMIGVTGPQRLALRLLGRKSAVTAGDLARLMHLHPSTVTGVLARLEKSGLVKRTVDRQDRRRFSLKLTAKGRRLSRQSAWTIEAAVEGALSRGGHRDVEPAVRLLLALADALRRSVDEPRPRR